jgi:hypothetical protein
MHALAALGSEISTHFLNELVVLKSFLFPYQM